MGRVTATVLFTDLVGSTELRGRLGEEAAEELLRKHDQLLAQAVESNNGRVVKGLGDGIMATFAGAADAVGAAVAIQQAVDRLNRSGKGAAPLAVRVGLSAGDVTFEDNDVHGTPVIEASRLCGAAVGGEILASEVVRWLGGAQRASWLTPVGSLELKGLAAPVPTVRVEWEPAVVSTIPMPALLTDVGRIFVGRDAELERLTQLWKEAAAGERRVALLAGEPGVGKTRLAAEMAMRVHEEGGFVLAGRCDEDLGVPYQPFVEALRHFVDHAPVAELKEQLGRYGNELVRLVPEVAGRVPDLPPPLQSDPETERYRLFDAVAAWLAAASAEEPVLVVLDDLQWAAKPTLLLLRHVVRASDTGRLLILATYRDTELGHDHPLTEVVADLRRQGGIDRVSLLGLDVSAVAAYIEEAAGHPLDDEDLGLARAVYEETEGNPFFVWEVLRHLTETGAIGRHEGRWGARLPVEELGIPESVRDVVGRRLSRLSKEANRVLRMAGVVGSEFELSVVGAATGLHEDAVLSAVEEAAQARLLIESAQGANRYRFTHTLVRDTLYGELSTSRRVSLHRQVAEAIEAVHAHALDEHLPALAHHWGQASIPSADTAKAIDYAARAGDRALAQFANDEAAAYYSQALGLASEDDGRRLELLISLGEAQRRAGDPCHRETLLAAARLAKEQGDGEALARAALANSRGLLSTAIGFLDDQQVGILEAALDALPNEDSPLRARLLATLGLELIYAYESAEEAVGYRHRRVMLCNDALAMARRLGDGATLAHVLLARYYPIAAPGNLSERLEQTAQLVALVEHFADPVISARAWWFRFRAATEACDFELASRALQMFERFTEDTGQPFLRWVATWNRGGQNLLAGRFEEADALFHEAHELGQAMGHRDADLFFAVQQFQLCFEQGRLEKVTSLVVDTAVAAPGVMLQGILALLYAELGRLDEARCHLDEVSKAQFLRVPLDLFWLRILADSAAVCARLADTERAAVLYDLLAPYVGQVVVILGLPTGPVAHYLGLLATTLHRHDEAERHFGTAATVAERAHAPTWLTTTQLEWARMLLTRRSPGDADRARQLLDRTLTTARELGLGNIERRVVALLQECP